MSERKKSQLKNYDFCYGMGCNWVDISTGNMYHIQEYREKHEKGEHPQGIRVTNGTQEKGYIGEYALRELMMDPEPDPRYLPETLEEHRRNF